MILDRDGIINYDYGYVGSPSRFKFIDQNIRIIAKLASIFKPIIITNQSGIARGLYSERDFLELTNKISNDLSKMYGVNIVNTYYCPHHPDFSKLSEHKYCRCRKPQSTLYKNAVTDYKIDVTQSITIGDNLRDVLPGIKLGFMENFLISKLPCKTEKPPEYTHLSNMSEILSHNRIVNLTD